MARYGPIALVAALLLATGAAFAYTERLKLTPSPILGTSVENKIFSPVCDCDTDVSVIRFRLRHADRIDVEVIDARNRPVRSLAQGSAQGRGAVELVWDGRDDAGAVVSEGDYRPRVRLLRQRRTITLPNPIRVDVTPPAIVRFSVVPRVLSPDGDGRHESVIARYRVSEPAQVALYVDGRRVVLKRGYQPDGSVRWDGRIAGEPVVRGLYRLQLGATDLAGNVAQRSRPAVVTVRYVAIGRERIVATAGKPFAVLVVSDARTVHWRLGKRRGTAAPGTLRLVAPTQPGRYALVVTANGHGDRSVVVVRAPQGGAR